MRTFFTPKNVLLNTDVLLQNSKQRQITKVTFVPLKYFFSAADRVQKTGLLSSYTHKLDSNLT